MAYTPLGEAQIYYETHGDGPAILFSAGGGGNHAIWWQQVPYFERNYRVVTLDYPGFGKTKIDADEFDILTFPDAILAVLDDLGIEKVTLIAQSLGGQPALSFAVQHPERVSGVVLVSSLGGIRDDAIHSLMLADRAKADELPVIDRLISPQFQADSPEMVFLFHQLGSFNEAVPGKNIKNTRNGATTLAQVQELLDGGIQVWFIWGNADVVRQESTYRKLGELLPGARHVVADGAPHTFYWERPEQFNTLVGEALASIHPVA